MWHKWLLHSYVLAIIWPSRQRRWSPSPGVTNAMSIIDTEARPNPGHNNFEVAINDTPHIFRDPIVTGEQVLQAVHLFPTDEYLVFQLLENGQLEELRL